MSFRPKTWVMVLIGALMTIISALLVHYVVSANMREISHLSAEKVRLQSSIDSFWKNSNRVESNLNTALVILSGATPNQAIITELVYSSGIKFDMPEGGISSEMVLGVGKSYRAGIISKINTFYEQQLQIGEQMMEIEERNSFNTNLALFFQVFGLILVLSRDLWSRH